MEMITDYGPDTQEETYIKEQLHALQLSYQKAAEPLVQTLARIRSYKVPRILFIPDPPPAPIREMLDTRKFDSTVTGY